MKKLLLSALCFVMALSLHANGPEYASKKTKEVVERMIEAHGGYEKWSQIETMSFSSAMHSESLGLLRFWIKDQVIEMKTRRTYQDWPLVGSKMSFDGERVWSVDWRVGNPPGHQHSVFFYYLNLPWLTQDEHVVLSETELIEHKGFDNKVYKVVMSYKQAPVVGKSARDTYNFIERNESQRIIFSRVGQKKK